MEEKLMKEIIDDAFKIECLKWCQYILTGVAIIGTILFVFSL